MLGTGNGRCVRALTCSAIMLTVVTGVAGCGGKTSAGGSSVATSTPATASSTPAASPTSIVSSASSTPTVASTGNPALGINGLPDAAQQKTTDGAIAFVKYYVAVVNFAGSKPQLGLVKGLSLDTCDTCERWESSAAYFVQHGQRIVGDQLPRGAGWDVRANLLDQSPPAAHIAVSFASADIPIRSANGSQTTQRVDSAVEVFLLRWTGTGWLVSDVQRDVA